MSLETRSSSALFKRAEQLKKWEESETNREPVVVNGRSRKIKFSAGCVFLAACKAGDKDEILRLLKKGADIDTSDVDGLSALHQACIDDNLELVEFLVEHGADVNKGDNEGWTPLHATASCGFLSIAKYLIEKGANVAAVNNDGELPVDVAESDEMEDMLQQEIENRGIDPEVARNEEERLMLSDAKNWLSQGYIGDKPHPKTGATALHVAAAKGYLKVMDVLVKAGADVDAQDLDGWTPLHAAAHWGQKEACEVLVEYGCDMGIRNCVGQTSFDVAETDMVRVLEDLRKKQSTMSKDNINNRRQITANKKISSIQENCVIPLGVDRLEKKDKEDKDEKVVEKNPASSEERLQKVELKIQSPTAPATATPRTPHETTPPPPTEASQTSVDSDEDVDSLSTETSDTESSDVSVSQLSETETNKSEKKNRVNRDESSRLPTMAEANKTVPNTPAPSSLPAKQVETEEAPSWRRPGSFRSRLQESLRPNLSLRITEKENPTTPGAVVSRDHQQETPQEVVLRRTQSFEADEKFYRRYLELRAKINAGNSCSVVHSATPVRSASLKERHPRRTQTRGEEPLKVSKSSPLSPVSSSTTASPATTTTTSTVAPTSPVSTSPQSGAAQIRSSTPSTPTTPGGSKLSPANIFKNFFKSFVPPVRDEESETQRKAHAKRVRETRRSTQGVTLEEIKSAEQLVKKKQQQQLQQATQILPSTPPSQPDERRTACEDEVVINVHNVVAVVPPPPVSSPGLTCSVPVATTTTSSSAEPVSATITTGAGGGTPTPTEERRPSWRLRVDNGSKFMLEDARKGETPGGIPSETVVRRTAVATPVTETGDTTITLPLRKNHRIEDKHTDAEKENESRNVQATQAAIQRRRRPKRRSTGVVHVDMDEIDPDRHGGGQEDSLANSVESGAENSEPSSRLNSEENSPVVPDRNATENGEILDYKKLYEESKVENNRLRCKLKETEGELAEAKTAAENSALLATRNSLSEAEKRERRAMERKLSEMEEELKQLQKLKSDNERLRAENRALTRVVSKLTSSHVK